jgi:hypothetical protein
VQLFRYERHVVDIDSSTGDVRVVGHLGPDRR